MHETTLLLIEVGALLLAMSLLGRLALVIGISPIPFYLILGLAFGEGGLLEFDASAEFFQTGAEIGVILLLALLGLEYTAPELFGSLKSARTAGLVDAALNALPGAAFALLLGWGPVAAVALAGVTWVSSSGVIAKLLRDLGRLSNRETPAILALLVIEDLAMAFYLPVLSAIVVGVSLLQGAIGVAVAVGVVAAHPLRRAATRSRRVAAVPGRRVRAAAARRARAHDARRRPRRRGRRVGRGRGVPRGHRPLGQGRREREHRAHAPARPVRGDLLRVLRAHDRLVDARLGAAAGARARGHHDHHEAPDRVRTQPGARASEPSANGAPGSHSHLAASSRS